MSICCNWIKQVLRKPSGRLGAAAVAAILTAVAIILTGKLALFRLECRIEQYRRNGVPVRLEEVCPYIEEDVNLRDAGPTHGSALLARGTYVSSSRFKGEVTGFPLFGDRLEGPVELDDRTCARVEEYLATQVEWRTILQALAEYDVCRARTYAVCDAYAEIQHPYLQPLAHGVTFLCLEALVAAHRAQSEAVLRSLTQARHVNRLILGEPFLPNIATAVRGEKTLIKVMERIVARTAQPSPATLTGLRRLCVPFGPEIVRQGVALERLAGLDHFYLSGIDAEMDRSYSFSYLSSMPLWLSTRKVDEFLDFTDGADRVCALPLPRWIASAIQLEETRGGTRHRINPLLSLGPPVFTMATGYQTYCTALAEMGQRLDQLMHLQL